MAESEDIQEIVNKAAMQVVTAPMMSLKDADVGPWIIPTSSQGEAQRQRHGRLVLGKPSFNWNLQDRYIGLLNLLKQKHTV